MIGVRDLNNNNTLWLNMQHIVMAVPIKNYETYELRLTDGFKVIVNYDTFLKIRKAM